MNKAPEIVLAEDNKFTLVEMKKPITTKTYFNYYNSIGKAFGWTDRLQISKANLYNDIIWRPLPWLEVDLETQFPLFNDSNFTEIASSVLFMPQDDLEIRLGYRRLSGHPILQNSNRIELETFIRLNDYWGIGTEHSFEIEDNTLELQRYNLHYDFDSWVGSVGLFHRDNHSEDEYGILFSFGLKEIPSLSLPISFDSE